MSNLNVLDCKRVSLMAAVFLAVPLTVSADDFFPLEIGMRWEYVSDAFNPVSFEITGERTILGKVTRVRRETNGFQVYENYWTKDEEGNVYLHGSVNLTFGIDDAAAYSPPIRMVQVPLVDGITWTTYGIQQFDLDGNYESGPFDFRQRVYGSGQLEVPAGEFFAFGIGNPDNPILRESHGALFDLLGRRVDVDGENYIEGGGYPTQWYSASVGVVMFNAYATPSLAHRLASWSFPTPVSPTSWGGVKALYR